MRHSPKKASDDVLEEPCSLGLDKLSDHVAQHSAYSIEALVGGADIIEAVIVQQNLLNNKKTFPGCKNYFTDR